MPGSIDHATREVIGHASPTRRRSNFIARLEPPDRRYGPRPASRSRRPCRSEDNGPIHPRRMSRAAGAARAHWRTGEWLPKYAPELDDIERIRHDLKAYHLAHQTFADTEDLDQAIHQAVARLNTERIALPSARPRISG